MDLRNAMGPRDSTETAKSEWHQKTEKAKSARRSHFRTTGSADCTSAIAQAEIRQLGHYLVAGIQKKAAPDLPNSKPLIIKDISLSEEHEGCNSSMPVGSPVGERDAAEWTRS